MHPQHLFRQMEHERFLQDTHYERRLSDVQDVPAPSATAGSLRSWLRATLLRRV